MHRASVLLLAALAVGGCRTRTRATVTTSPAVRQAPGAEIVTAPAAVASSPLAGPEGNDAAGFPRRHVDRVALRTMLARRQFAELSRFFEEVETVFEADSSREDWPMDAADAFASAEPAIVPTLDAWVAATPESFAPYLARATHWMDAGHARRGSRWSRDTPPADMALMREAFVQAQTDLDRTLELRPKQTAAHRLRLLIARHEGDGKRAEGTISAALAACPSCLRVRATYILNSSPRWGGSYSEIERFVKQSASSGPAMKLLPGFVDIARASDLEEAKKITPALAALDHACSLGERWEFYDARADLQTWNGDTAKALSDAEHAVVLSPANPDALATRSAAHLALKHYEQAGNDLRAVFAAEPTHERGKHHLPTVVTGLVWQADQYRTAGRREDAIRLLDLAAELAPDDPRVTGTRSWTILGDASAPGSIEALEAAAKQAPDDFAIHQQLDYALAKQNLYPRVVEMWTTFLAAHPDNARAYLERGGANIHIGKRAEAKADATKACELGLGEACARVKRLP